MNLFESYSQRLADNNIINSADMDLYSYGLKQGIIIIANLMTTLAIGFVFGMLFESIIITASYIPIRIYSGGYHSKTQLSCYLVSVIIIIVELVLIKNLNINIYISLILSTIFGLIIFVLSPVEDQNKPLDNKEIVVYKKRSRTILLFEISILYVLMYLNISNISKCILMSLGLMALMLIVGKLKNDLRKVIQN